MRKKAELGKILLVIGMFVILIAGIFLFAMVLKSKFGDKNQPSLENPAQNNSQNAGEEFFAPEEPPIPQEPMPDLQDLP